MHLEHAAASPRARAGYDLDVMITDAGSHF